MAATIQIRDMSGETQSVDMAAREIKHLISTLTLDSYDTVLMPMGCDDQTRFAKLPNVWGDHRYGNRDVIGQNRGIAKSEQAVGAKTYILPRPPTLAEGLEWYPDTFLWMHFNKFLRGWSVGFDPVADGSREPNDAEKEKWPGIWRIYEKWCMVEYSGVGLPSNIGALTNARGWQDRCSRRGFADPLIRHIERGRPATLAVMRRSLVQPNRIIVSVAPEKPIRRQDIAAAFDAMYARVEKRVTEETLRPIRTAPLAKK